MTVSGPAVLETACDNPFVNSADDFFGWTGIGGVIIALKPSSSQSERVTTTHLAIATSGFPLFTLFLI